MRGQQSGLVLVRSRRPPPRGLLLPSRPLAQVLVVLLLGLWVWPSSAAEFYVAPAGDDAGNTGTSPTSPFRTVSKAMSTANSGDSIYLANGVYSGPGNIGVLVADVHVSLIGESQEGTIFDCMGASGPVFDVSFGTPLFANLTIQHCFSMSSSGAMTISGITVSASLVNVTIRYCSSNSVGGAIQVQLANATFDNVRLENNAAVNGGSLFIVSSPHIHVRNMFDFNSTAINGAAIYATATSIDIHDSVFALSAASSLGVVYLALSKCEVTTSRFEGTAGTSIFTSQAQLLIDDCVFSGNTNQLSGSAVQITATDTNDGSFDRILNSLFVDNTAYDRGALYVKNGGYAVVQNCTFLRNRSFSGGAVSVTTDGTAFLYNCTLQDNSATSAVSNATISSIIMDGGGALEASKSGAFLSADNCIMVNNTSQYGGAVFAGSKGTVIINGSNTVIANNTAWFMGGGLYVQDSATIIVANSFNVSVEQNVAVFGGGFAIGSKGTLMLSNVIARGNMAALAGSGGYVSGTFVPSHVYYDGNVAGKLSGGVVLFSDPASAKVCDTCVVLPNNLEIFDGGSVRTSRITTGPSVIFMRSYSDTFSFAPGGNGTAVNPYVSTIRIVPGTFLGISLEVHDAFGSTLEGVGPEYRITADFLPAGVGAFRFYIPGPLSGGKFAGALPFIGQFNTTFTLFIRLTYVDSHLVPNVGPLVLEFSTADSCGPDQVEQKVAISNMASLPNCVATELSTVASSAFISIQAVTSLFALFTIVVFLLIRGFRSHRAIRAASPTLLQLMLAATSLVFVAIFLMGVDTESDEVTLTHLPATGTNICRTLPWLLGFGFDLVFGTMFAKTWRIHKIFNSNLPRRVLLSDAALVRFTLLFALHDVIINTVWVIVAPLSLQYSEISSSDQLVVMTTECRSDHFGIFLGVYLAVKGIALLLGVYLAVRCRHVSDQFNESKQLGFAIYNLTVTSTVIIPLVFLLNASATAIYLIAAIGTLYALVMTIAIIFLPKIWYFCSRGDPRLEQAASAPAMAANVGPWVNVHDATVEQWHQLGGLLNAAMSASQRRAIREFNEVCECLWALVFRISYSQTSVYDTVHGNGWMSSVMDHDTVSPSSGTVPSSQSGGPSSGTDSGASTIDRSDNKGSAPSIDHSKSANCSCSSLQNAVRPVAEAGTEMEQTQTSLPGDDTSHEYTNHDGQDEHGSTRL